MADDVPMQVDGQVSIPELAKNLFLNFLTSFQKGDEEGPFYAKEVQRMSTDVSATMYIDYGDLKDYTMELADIVRINYYLVEPSLRKAAQNFVHQVNPDYTVDDEGNQREFYVNIYGLPEMDKLRDLKVEKVGQLSCFCGTVTRTSEVRPELFLGAFLCLECNTVVRGVEQQFKYTTPLICTNPTCGNRKNWSLRREDSVFVDWQRVKVQENADEVPAGSLPRTMDIIMRNEQVETAKAGDKMVFTGMLVVVPDVGALAAPGQTSVKSGNKGDKANASDGFTMKSFGARELTYKLMFIANNCQPADVRAGMVNIRSDDDDKPEDVLASYEEKHQREVLEMSHNENIYAALTRSVCPSVFGHDSIKQAVLLMLFGGVHKRTKEGINLRGDINVAIVGDPSCAKSQILKYVANFLPRAVYTSGKASSAAGLTASVVKEPENNEFAIEAGALMLADNGICCIDEFDKMDIKDQVAIHEAMEQQTISIAKAGIQATLNARASVLAAANPMGGRYDKSKPLKYNVALPPAILSRFDLLHVMIDDTDDQTDVRIARHILDVHRFQSGAFAQVPFKTEAIQRYIRYARAIKPMITQEAADKLVRAYKELRSEDATPGSQSAYRITVRQLEALVRLSEAMARVYCDHQVKPRHVDEAKRLLKSSILKIEQSDIELDDLMPVPPVQPEDLPQQEQQQQDGEDTVMENTENVPGAANGVAGTSGANSEPTAKRARLAEAPSEQAADGQGAGQQEPAAAAQTKQVKISAQKFTYVKNMLVKRLQEVQEEQDRRALQEGVEPEEGAGISQRELMSWYLEAQAKRGALKGSEEAETEMELLFKVINHLIRKDATLAVLSRPNREASEDDATYLQRLQTERVLILHSNYAPEV